MTENIARVWELVEHYQLHQGGAPVSLDPLHEICELTYDDLSRYGITGMCYAEVPASKRSPAQIVVCKTLDDDWRRITYAHEAAHGIFGHSGAMSLDEMDPWFWTHEEREAWQAAAIMLVPPLDRVQLTESTMDGLAAACHIPRWLLDLYL